MDLQIPNAKLWSDETPNLYTARIHAIQDYRDETEVIFGIRQITWSSKGLFVNGQNTLLRGGCIHHDNGILGSACYAQSEDRKVRILKQEGFNAIRCAHNPASTALLNACDRYGMYVMDETFDMWYNRKNKFDYGCDFENCWEQDVTSMVERDYNHPSVILYSIGNEVSEPVEQKGLETGKRLIDLCHRLDSSRPVTCGANLMIMSRDAKGNGIYKDGEQAQGAASGKEKKEGHNTSLFFNMMTSLVGTNMNRGGNSKKVDALTTPFLDSLDIAGYNYASGRYPLEGKAHPNRVVVGSETFPQDIYKNWQMVKRYPWLVGDFMWTAWDYLGEVGIGAWSYTGGQPFHRPYPWLLAGTGVIDILGVPDGSCKYAATVWGFNKNPVIAVRPVNHPGVRASKSVWRGTNAILSWSWQGCVGNAAQIEVYADAAEVELLLKGHSLGKKKIKNCMAMFETRYIPGTLTAIAFDENGNETGRSKLRSAKKAHTKIRPEKSCVQPGEIVYIPVTIEDDAGIVESNADRQLTVTVQGGELLGFGSANPCTEERYGTGTFTSYQGHALAVVRAGDDGCILVTVKDSKTVASAQITIQDAFVPADNG